MRILICVQNYKPAYSFGGSVGNAIALAEGLAKLGHSVSVVTSSVVELTTPPNRRDRTETVAGVKVHYLGTWWTFRKTSLNPSVFAFAKTQLTQFDAIHIIGLYNFLGIALASFAQRANIPYSVEPSGMLVPAIHSLQLKRIYHQLFGTRLLKAAQCIIVTSQIEWDDATKFGIPVEKLQLRPNGVDLSEYQHLPPPGNFRQKWGLSMQKPLILWLGRIEKIKNLEQLLLAVSKLGDLKWQLAITGPTESKIYLESLRTLSQQLHLNEHTHFIPAVYGNEKLAAYVDADLLVLVSIYENWGNTVQEAIAAGVPVLVTSTCGVSAIVEGKGGLVVEQNVDAISNGLRKLLTDMELYRNYQAQLPALSASLSWDEPVKKMVQIFYSWK
ncbi:MAG: glycosyltransferase [Chroococcus sp. CMT-3BRIN-NPC107]|jgi:glycosyltransferase involved in cell wall biosynthesis|nr:glycosyltransferase [Chroococcus sp. CMT-3BRIN-NPC107]